VWYVGRTGTGTQQRGQRHGVLQGLVHAQAQVRQHRVMYDIQSDVVTIIACRSHYDDH